MATDKREREREKKFGFVWVRIWMFVRECGGDR